MWLVQILGGLFGVCVAYLMDYFFVTRPMKKEEEKVRQELLEIRNSSLNKFAGTR